MKFAQIQFLDKNEFIYWHRLKYSHFCNFMVLTFDISNIQTI